MRRAYTLIAASAFQEGIDIAGIVLNQAKAPVGDDPSLKTNAEDLRRYCVPPLLAEISFGEAPKFDRVDFVKLGKRFKRDAVGIEE